MRSLKTADERRALLDRVRRSHAALWSGLFGGAVGIAVGTRLRGAVDRRSASRAFRGTPCSALPPAGERGHGGNDVSDRTTTRDDLRGHGGGDEAGGG